MFPSFLDDSLSSRALPEPSKQPSRCRPRLLSNRPHHQGLPPFINSRPMPPANILGLAQKYCGFHSLISPQ
ncbi:hypothetical protein Hanom_Chr00s109863g01807281 [Helianthus anomalus]